MGKVYIVGAGPGDPELITIKALKCIQQADVILYDRLVNKELLTHSKPFVELVYCGKSPNNHTCEQEMINHLLVKYASSGKIVTRLKGGDPFIFGRGGEEAEVLTKNGIPYEVVPGITAGIAAPAYAGIPITHRDVSSSFAVVTGHKNNGEPKDIDWKSLANGVDTLAIYMGIKNLPYICHQLIRYKRNSHTPVAIIHNGTTSNQQTITGTLLTIVDTAKKANIRNPSMIVVGEVVHFHEKLFPFIEQTVVSNIHEAFV
jgi:uroporphyrin-III C-methyltransferase